MKKLKNNFGVTLVELLISVTLLSILLIAFTSAYTMGISVYKKEFKTTVLQNENRILLDRIITDIKQSSSIDPASTDSNLILKTPGIDENNALLTGAMSQFLNDTISYERVGNILTKTTVPDESSVRVASSKDIATNINSLTFTYFPDVNSTTEVEVSLQTRDTYAGKNIDVINVSRAKLRNK